MQPPFPIRHQQNSIQIQCHPPSGVIPVPVPESKCIPRWRLHECRQLVNKLPQQKWVFTPSPRTSHQQVRESAVELVIPFGIGKLIASSRLWSNPVMRQVVLVGVNSHHVLEVESCPNLAVNFQLRHRNNNITGEHFCCDSVFVFVPLVSSDRLAAV